MFEICPFFFYHIRDLVFVIGIGTLQAMHALEHCMGGGPHPTSARSDQTNESCEVVYCYLINGLVIRTDVQAYFFLQETYICAESFIYQ